MALLDLSVSQGWYAWGVGVCVCALEWLKGEGKKKGKGAVAGYEKRVCLISDKRPGGQLSLGGNLWSKKIRTDKTIEAKRD